MAEVVVCSYLPGEGHYRSDRFMVNPVCCRHDLDYWRGLAAWWDTDRTIVNVEHDIEVTDDHVAAILDCPHTLCVWAYECHWASTGHGYDVIAARNPDGWVRDGTPWAEQAAIGFVKIAQAARSAPLSPAPWNRLEVSVEASVSRPFHVHWPPIPHHHW